MNERRIQGALLPWLGAGLAASIIVGLARALPIALWRDYDAHRLHALLARQAWLWVAAHGAAGVGLAAGLLVPIVLARRIRSGNGAAVAAATVVAAGIGLVLWRTWPDAVYQTRDALALFPPQGGASGPALCAMWGLIVGLVLSPAAAIIRARFRPSLPQRLVRASGTAALVIVAALGLVTALMPPPRLNVLLITLDAQRADHLHCYRYHRDNSPNIDRLAARGALFLNANANAPWTLPSLASVMTGRLPMDHGATTIHRGLAPGQWLLADALLRNGYRTGGAGASEFLGIPYRVTAGFESFLGRGFSDPRRAGIMRLDSGPWITQFAVRFMQRHRREPFFLWLHYLEPHDPYDWHADHHYIDAPPRGMPRPLFLDWLMSNRARLMPRQIQEVVDLYDGETWHVDRYVAKVLKTLDDLGLTGTTLVILSSDHGEEFMQHGSFGHVCQIYEDELHVPLIMAAPGRIPNGVRITTPVQLVDLAPTVLDFCGINERIPGLRGQSLRPLLGSRCGYRPADIVASLTNTNPKGGDVEVMRSIRRGNWKLLLKPPERRAALYDLASDPGERYNLAGRGLAVERELRSAIAQYDRVQRGRRLRLSDRTKEELRGMGYLR